MSSGRLIPWAVLEERDVCILGKADRVFHWELLEKDKLKGGGNFGKGREVCMMKFHCLPLTVLLV